MDGNNNYYWNKVKSEDSGLEFLVLGYKDKQKGNLEAWITPGAGSNLCRFSVDGRNVIDFDPELMLNKDYTGTPILYPTPNRVRNGMFLYRGRIYNQVKRGESVFEHGLVHSEKVGVQRPCDKGRFRLTDNVGGF
jgi:aldose 1-epimerase